MAKNATLHAISRTRRPVQQYVEPLSIFSTHDVKEFQDVRGIFQELTQAHAYVLAISIQGKYFES
jgi:hypothetical protein